MADVSLEWQGDFELTPAGDLLLADDNDLARQWILRRLFTQVYGYVWHLEYGAGLPQKIGSTYQPQQIEAIVRAQMLMEEGVAQSPPPVVKVAWDQNSPGLQVIGIKYTDAQTDETISLTMQVPSP